MPTLMEATGSSYKINNSVPKMTLTEQSTEREKKEIQLPSRKSVLYQQDHSSHYTLRFWFAFYTGYYFYQGKA